MVDLLVIQCTQAYPPQANVQLMTPEERSGWWGDRVDGNLPKVKYISGKRLGKIRKNQRLIYRVGFSLAAVI